MLRNLALLILPVMLTGCIAQSDIQADYMSQESDCRRSAETRGEFGDKEDAANTAYRIGSAFSSCMNKSGWKVSVPKPPGPPPGAPLAPTTPPASVAAPVRAPVVQQAPTTPPAPVAAPRMAAPTPSQGVPANSGYSTYRPDGMVEPDYRSGAAGRNF